jgi:hypothetical protein
MANWLAGTFSSRPARPPTSGRSRANQATAKVPVMVMPNCSVSVTNTPHRPETEAKKMVMTPHTIKVRSMGQPSTTLPIFAAERFTAAMMMQLKNRPRNTARKPRRARAARPE